MRWTVRTLQLPTVKQTHHEYPAEEAAWMAYLAAIEESTRNARGAEQDLAIGIDLHCDGGLVEQHWITLAAGLQRSGRHSS